MPRSHEIADAGSMTSVTILRFEKNGLSRFDETLAIEEPLEIQVAYERSGLLINKSISVTMRTPGHDGELAVGFLFTEGLLASRDQIEKITSVKTNVLRLSLRPGTKVDLRNLERHFYTTSSCGVCGKTSLQSLRATRQIALSPEEPVFDTATILKMPVLLRAAQSVFDQTGGLHAAGLFDADGRLTALREDVGRHNAVDKVIGSRVLAGHTSLPQSALMVSGRASFELMQKAVMAGIPVLVAVGAPSSLAVELAKECGATLLGFVRENRFNIYSGINRIEP
jgi:FdhD protein